MTTIHSSDQDSDLAARLTRTKLFESYQEAFHLATYCNCHLVARADYPAGGSPAFPFLHEFHVPVQFNGRIIAYLCTEPLRICCDSGEGFDDVANRLLNDGCSAAELRTARRRFEEARGVTPSRARALEITLEMFAFQLGETAGRLFLQTIDCEPNTVQRARKYILENLAEPIHLEEVAKKAGMSVFHFCKVFKRFTGLTFTAYVSKARIEQAKRLLLKPQARVTEVAYDVGFQSLSQFNRSFRRIVSLSPTEYRENLRKRALAEAA